MNKVLASLALAVSALTLSAAAQANVVGTTITFDPVDTSTLYFPPLLVYGDEFYTPGINGRTMWFDPASNSPAGGFGDIVGSILNGPCSDLACPVNNATNYVGLTNDGFLAFGSVESGFTFSVQSLSAGFIANIGDLVASTPAYLALQGSRKSDGLTLTAYYALTGLDANGHLNFSTIDTGVFGDYEFDTVYAYSYWCSDSSCQAFSTNKGQFALDDIVIEHVPEPASLALVGIAGLALAGARRRRTV